MVEKQKEREETSLARKIVLRINLVSCAVLATFGAIIVYVSATSVRDAMESKIQSMAFYISRESESYMRTFDFYALEGFARQAVQDPDIEFVEFHYTKEGSNQIVAQARSGRTPVPAPAPGSIPVPAPRVGGPVSSHGSGRQDYVVSRAIISDGEQLGYVVVGYNNNRISAAVQKVVWIDILAILSEQLLLILGVVALLRKTTVPLRRAMSLLQKISRTGDYSLRMKGHPEAQSDIRELKVFAREFDHMLSEIQARDEQIRKARAELEVKVRERTIELEQLHKQSLRDAHLIGMAEVATEVIHNIGNVLNSIVISLQVIKKKLANSKLPGLAKANKLMAENARDVTSFLGKDARGPELLAYYQKLNQTLEDEHRRLEFEADELSKKVELVTDIIRAQRLYATDRPHRQKLKLIDLVEDALSIEMPSLEKRAITIERQYENAPLVRGHATKLIQVLLNLITNAEDAMECNPAEKVLQVHVFQDEKGCYARFTDNGVGIERESLQAIFRQGFTTKERGHGFGLHYAANAMSEIGGALEVESEGKGQGATFLLRFPIAY